MALVTEHSWCSIRVSDDHRSALLPVIDHMIQTPHQFIQAAQHSAFLSVSYLKSNFQNMEFSSETTFTDRTEKLTTFSFFYSPDEIIKDEELGLITL